MRLANKIGLVTTARYADPKEIAHATLSLVLPASTYINGVALPVNGD